MSDAPGWDAINAALAPLYGGQQPRHFGTVLNYRLGGPDPLDGISVYVNPGPPEHWHFVSYGLSELYAKESDDAGVSGFGFELTFRLARPAGEDEPPAWALSFLQNLARYVYQTGNAFAAEHSLNANGPISLDRPTELRAMVFTHDPQLPPTESANGRLAFLQIVGLTLDELHALEGWEPAGLLGVLAEDNPLLVTDLARPSILADPVKAARVAEGTARDGSSCAGVFVRALNVAARSDTAPPVIELTLGANQVAAVQRLLVGRILHGRPFTLRGREVEIVFRPADPFACRLTDDGAEVDLPAAGARQLAEMLRPSRGEYAAPLLQRFTVRVVPTDITDQLGNVIEVIG